MEPEQIIRNDAPLARPWQLKPLGDTFDEAAHRFASREALVYRDDRYTYRDFQHRVDAFAKGLLELGVQPGDHVGIMMGNYPEWLFTQFATAKVGARLVPINTRFRTSELEYILRQGDVTTLVMNDLFLGKFDFLALLNEICPEVATSEPGAIKSPALPRLRNVIVHSLTGKTHRGTIPYQAVLEAGSAVSDEELRARQAAARLEDAVEVMYTSGTTGYPKGALRNHFHVLHQAFVGSENMAVGAEDRMYNPNPFFHNFGNHFAGVIALLNGATHVFAETFDPGLALQLMARERCTILLGFAPFFVMLMDHPDLAKYDLKATLRTGTIGFPGVRDPMGMLKSIFGAFGLPEITSAYGMTETAGLTCQSRAGDPPEVVAFTVGRLVNTFEVALVSPETGHSVGPGEPGELWVRGPKVMLGYYNKPVETAAAIDSGGWFHTKDLLSRDADGFFHFVGRSSEMMKVGGENVDPAEVERIVGMHPKVAEVQVTSVPDRRLGDVPAAFIQLKPGEQATDGEIIAFCRSRMASFKVPRYVRFVAEYPLTPSGKIQKYVLRQEAMKELGL